MKIKIMIEELQEDGSQKIVKNLGTCYCDNIARALQMYEDELSDQYPQRLIYQHMD